MWKLAIIICLIAPCVSRAQEKGFQTPVLVTFPEGTTVTDLPPGELLTELDGHEVNHGTPVNLSTVPLRVGLVFDESGSARRSALLSVLHQRVLDWVAASLAQHGGDAFLVGFNDQIIISTETTTDISQLRRALSQLRPIGGSAVRDAIVHSTRKFYALGMESKLTARILLVLSDGFDNASRARDRDALQSAQRSGVRIYAIGYSSPEVKAGGSLLTELCRHTGGMCFFPGSDQGEISSALTTIDRDLAHSFLVSVSPPIPDAKFHHLSLKLPKMPHTNLRYMSGFYSP
ncbi:MAG TPA: VWA domain-containing protein [Terriglobia bacterium]|nr:VWA domain-containing protein [Terriglobia bacterium]